jgi:hypothetical protein
VGADSSYALVRHAGQPPLFCQDKLRQLQKAVMGALSSDTDFRKLKKVIYMR